MRIDTAKEWDDIDVEDFANLGGNLVNLLAKLASRRQDEGDWAIFLGKLRLLEHVRDQWDQEGERLA